MRKRSGIILVGVLALCVIVSGYFIFKEKKVVVIDPWLAIPSDAVFIIETPDFPELLTKITDQNGLIHRMGSMKWAADIEKDAATIDSISGSREIREIVSGKEILISLHPVGQGRLSPLVVFSAGPAFRFKRLNQLLIHSGAVTSTVRELGGVKSLTATYGKGKEKVAVHMALTSGIIVISTSETLVANALNNNNTGSDVRNQQGFTPVVHASGKELDNIFILFRNLPKFIQTFIREEEIPILTSVAVAAGGDITLSEGGLFISGFLSTSGTGQGADGLKKVAPAEQGVHEVLPAGTVSYKTIMQRSVITGSAAQNASLINATDLALAVSPFMGNEVTVASLLTDTAVVKAVFFRMNDRQNAETLLRERLTAKYSSMGLREKHFLVSSKSENGEQINIYKLPFTGVSSLLSSEPSETLPDSWVTFCRSYMIFASSPEILVTIRTESDKEKTLINDPEFREMEKSLPSKSSLYFYISGRAIKDCLKGFVKPVSLETVAQKSLEGIEAIGLSLSPSNNMIYTSLSLRYRDQKLTELPGEIITPATGDSSIAVGDDQGVVWKTKLLANLAVKPFFFTNHNTGATEIFVQDFQNNIYLLSSAGRILWQTKVRERVVGDVFMIDYYKNGKNQILFAGREYLHLIDRNGNYVDKFPVKLKSPASNKLAVFDYENSREYRLCIAGVDRKLYVYDRSGVAVKGWNLFSTKGVIEDQIAFFRVKGKDYLVAADDQSVYILDRTGNVRVNLKEPVVKAKGSRIRLSDDPEPALVFTSPDGSVVKVAFDGSVKRFATRTFSPGHLFDFFDLNSDGANEYIYIDKGILYVYGTDGTELFSMTFETTDLAGPVNFVFSSTDRKIGIYEGGKQMIYVLNKTGSAASGFPRSGGAYYSAGKLSAKSRWSFIYGDYDGYLYNFDLNN